MIATGTPIRLAEVAMVGNSFLAAASEVDGGVGLVRVVYGGYVDAGGNLAWRILHGADREGVPDTDEIYEPMGTSVPDVTRRFEKSVAIPRRVPTDATTHFTLFGAAIVPLGPTQLLVPLTPQGGFFVSAE